MNRLFKIAVSNIVRFLHPTMSSKKSVILSGVIAAIVAIALIGTAALSGVLARPTTSLVSTTQPTSGSSGTLAVLLTDPPTVPFGTTALFATYSTMGVHVSGEGNDSGWIRIPASGTINLMGVVNATQTIASAKIQEVFSGVWPC